MAGAYSERFILWGASNWSPYYTVPAGKRAVIKSVSSANPGNSASSVWLEVKDITVWYGSVPGVSGLAASGLMVVLYAGEHMRVYNGASGQATVICGFLLIG